MAALRLSLLLLVGCLYTDTDGTPGATIGIQYDCHVWDGGDYMVDVICALPAQSDLVLRDISEMYPDEAAITCIGSTRFCVVEAPR